MVDIMRHRSILQITRSLRHYLTSGENKPFIMPVATAVPDIVVRLRLFYAMKSNCNVFKLSGSQ